MTKLVGLISAFMLALIIGNSATPALADAVKHRVAIHVNENNKARMNMALNNAFNIDKFYKAAGETVQIEIVTYGPGLHMLRADTSPVKDRIAALSLELDDISFAACGNTKAKMAKKGGKEIVLVAEAKNVPSGVVRLMELQEQGWSYVRP
ncbi:MAG: DsrE family protein [Alphaproteobacteria bacterium]